MADNNMIIELDGFNNFAVNYSMSTDTNNST